MSTPKPKNPTSQVVGNGWFYVTWDALSGAEGYESQHEGESHVSRQPTPQSALLAIPGGTTRYTQIRNVKAGQHSGWVKVTLNDAGEIIDIDYGDDPEPGKPPNPPRNARASDIAAREATVVWDAPAAGGGPVDHYHLGWSEGNSGETLGEDTTTSRSYRITGLTPDKPYACAVTSVGTNGSVSRPVTAHWYTEPEDDNTPPAPPSGLHVLRMNVPEQTATVAWDYHADVHYWEVLLENVFGGYRKSTSYSYEFYDLEEGREYSYRVRAVRKNSQGKLLRGPATRDHFVFTGDEPPPPPPPPVPVPKPEGVRTHCITQSSAIVEWNDNPDVDGWEVWIGDRETAQFTTSTRHNVSGLTPNTSYTVCVVARQGEAESEIANDTFVTMKDEPDPEGDLPTPEHLHLETPRPGVLQAQWSGSVPPFKDGTRTEDAFYLSCDGLRTQTQTDSNAHEWTGLPSGEYVVELYRATDTGISGIARKAATVKGGW